MAGKKGRSGRKSWDKELELKELWELSYSVLKKALQADEKRVSLSKKIKIAQSIIIRMIPNPASNSVVNTIATYDNSDSQVDFDEREKKSKEELAKLFNRR